MTLVRDQEVVDSPWPSTGINDDVPIFSLDEWRFRVLQRMRAPMQRISDEIEWLCRDK